MWVARTSDDFASSLRKSTFLPFSNRCIAKKPKISQERVDTLIFVIGIPVNFRENTIDRSEDVHTTT